MEKQTAYRLMWTIGLVGGALGGYAAVRCVTLQSEACQAWSAERVGANFLSADNSVTIGGENVNLTGETFTSPQDGQVFTVLNDPAGIGRRCLSVNGSFLKAEYALGYNSAGEYMGVIDDTGTIYVSENDTTSAFSSEELIDTTGEGWACAFVR